MKYNTIQIYVHINASFFCSFTFLLFADQNHSAKQRKSNGQMLRTTWDSEGEYWNLDRVELAPLRRNMWIQDTKDPHRGTSAVAYTS